MRSPRSIVALLTTLSLMVAAQTVLCPRTAGCTMQGAKSGSARPCTPAMGKDCCKPRQSPANAPQRTEDQVAKAAPALAALPVVTQTALAWLGSSPAPAGRIVPQAQPVPLYTLFATLLI